MKRRALNLIYEKQSCVELFFYTEVQKKGPFYIFVKDFFSTRSFKNLLLLFLQLLTMHFRTFEHKYRYFEPIQWEIICYITVIQCAKEPISSKKYSKVFGFEHENGSVFYETLLLAYFAFLK